jgi:hypothetical protein
MCSTSSISNEGKIQILNILEKNNYCISILKFVKQLSEENLWIGGGFIRNIVWDEKHAHKINTEFGDIDVFYFNSKCIDKDRDIEIEKALRKIAPNVEWSVKNQARMHLHNNEAPYISLEDALSKFPDTASSIVVRLSKNSNIEFIAPYGYSDLFNLLVRPTPIFLNNEIKMQRYYQRINEKKWKVKWPNLIIQKCQI